ncbi:MAG: monomethylamine:corrinoid methyltransferase [Candidatus Bathyarchaeia archaeon]
MGTFKLFDIVERARTGSLVKESDFEAKLIPNKLKELVKEYDIKLDPEILIPSDNDLADSVFKAAYDFILDLGVYCTDTGRIIKIYEEDLKEALKSLPEKVIIGSGRETRELIPRNIEDKKLPSVIGGLAGGVCSSENYLNILTSIAMEPNIDMLCAGSITEIEGKPIIRHSPIEIHAAQCEALWMREAAARAGRPGLCLIGSSFEWAAADIASFNPKYGFRSTDAGLACIIYPMKISFNMLSKIKHYLECERPIFAYSDQLIGGFTRGAEETVVSCIAHHLANLVLNQASFQELNCQDIRYNNKSNRLSIWCHNVVGQALARNTKIITHSECFASAGPCTDMILYEGAAVALSVVSGVSLGPGIVGRATKEMDKYTGLECRFYAEVGKACLGLKREDANELVKELVKKYEDKFKDPPLGKTFNECYDVKAMKPTKEWLDIYERVWKELEDLGIKFF